MAKEIAYSRISTKLQNLKAAHPQDVSAKLWRETFKDLINGSEAMRLFDVFAGTLMLLEARNNKYLTWSTKANSANWTAKWLENIFKKYDILSKYGPTTDATGKALHPRTKKVLTFAIAPYRTAPNIPKVSEKQLIGFKSSDGDFVKLPDLTTLNDEALEALSNAILTEKKRRETEAKKAELLKVFSDMAKDEGFSLEDILGVI